MPHLSPLDEMAARGLSLHEAGQFQEAEALYRQVLAQNPDHPKALHLLGVLAYQHQRYELARDLICRAIAGNSKDAACYSDLGEVYRSLQQNEAALEAYRQAGALDPNLPEPLCNLGKLLYQMDRLGESEQFYLKALATCQTARADHPELPRLWNSLGIIYARLHLTEKAQHAFQQAVALKPDMDGAWHNLGTIYGELACYDEAETAYRRALGINPNFPQAYKNLGICLQRRGAIEQAIQAYESTIALEPEYAEAHWNLALALLLGGDYPRGWREYEWRWKYNNIGTPVRDFPQPLWRGEELGGKTILLHTEQAYGDAIQFARYVSLVAERGAKKIIIECQPDLVTLFERIPKVSGVFARFAELPPFDVQVPFMSLALALGTTVETIPHQVPYLSGDPELTARFGDILKTLAGHDDARSRPRVGLAWSGSSDHPNNRNRSISLATLAPLLGMQDVTYVSLQKESLGSLGIDSSTNILDLSEHLVKFAETAALIENLDLVVTVDTSIAHLAGALAKPTFLLLPHAPDWRWMLGRADSPWYPTMRLFRQKAHGDWAGVMEEVVEALRKFQGVRTL